MTIVDDDRAIALDPGNPTSHHYQGMARRKPGQLDRAINDFEAALRLEPLSNTSRTARAVQREQDEAIPYLGAVPALDPDNADALRGRGMAGSALRTTRRPSATLTVPWP